MARYHISPSTGNASPCRATQACPFGDMTEDHYASAEEARAAYEKKQTEKPAEKAYPQYSEEESREIATTMKRQIGVMTLMSLGASEFTAINGGLRFKARILPFNDNGTRSGRAAKMFVEVRLNGLDYYDVKVHHVKGFTASTHYEQENVDAHSLSDVLFSLDYDGPTVRNPRV